MLLTVRVVQSRFMQAAAAKSKGPMKATDRVISVFLQNRYKCYEDIMK